MKNRIIFIGFLLSIVMQAYGQRQIAPNNSISICKVVDSTLNHELKRFITRNFLKNIEKGIVVVQFTVADNGQKDFEFNMTKILGRGEFYGTKPVGVMRIKKRLIFFYGPLNSARCTQTNDKLKAYEAAKYLIDDNPKTMRYIVKFDPEIVKITVKNNIVVSRQQLDKQLDLTK